MTGRGASGVSLGKDLCRGVVLTGGESERRVNRRASGPGVAAAIDGDELHAAGVSGDRNVRGNPGGGGRPAAVEGSPGCYGRGGRRGRSVTGRPGFPTLGIHWVGVAMHGDDRDWVAARPRVDRRRHRDRCPEPARQGAGGEDGHVTTVAYPGDDDSVRIGAFGGSQLGHQCRQERHVAIAGGTERFQDLVGPAALGSTASMPAAIARAGIRLCADKSSEVRPYPGSPITRGSRW